MPVLSAMCGRSRHPLSKTLFARLGEQPERELEGFTEQAGVGLSARAQGRGYRLIRSESGKSVLSAVDFREDGTRVATFEFQDEIQEGASQALSGLREKGLSLVLLSGDSEAAVARVGEALGFSENERHARLLPDQKARWVERAQETGGSALMVGDGVNDALSMKKADLSIAVHGGMEVALKAASAYALNPGLGCVKDAFAFSRRMRRTLAGSFWFSTFYNAVACGFAVAGKMSPLFAAVVMPVSALSVFAYIGFSLRSLPLQRGERASA